MKFLDNAALIIIDVQHGFDDIELERNNLDAEKNIQKILENWRKTTNSVIHIKHISKDENSILHPSKQRCDFKKEVQPIDNEVIITKQENSAFINTNLQEFLNEQQVINLVIVGLTTDHCVSSTTRMAQNLGFKVMLISDATATFAREDENGNIVNAELVHHVNLASLKNEFAQLNKTSDLVNALQNIHDSEKKLSFSKHKKLHFLDNNENSSITSLPLNAKNRRKSL